MENAAVGWASPTKLNIFWWAVPTLRFARDNKRYVMDSSDSQFVFITCQVGAESAVKNELAREQPDWRFAYSRHGFLTFKLPAGVELADDFWLGSAFARSFGKVLGTARGESVAALAGEVWRIVDQRSFDALHVWPRDAAEPGTKKGTGPICRNGPEGAAHKLDLSPFSAERFHTCGRRPRRAARRAAG